MKKIIRLNELKTIKTTKNGKYPKQEKNYGANVPAH